MYIDEEHSLFLLQRLSLLRQNKDLCDVELRVGETSFHVHKVVLAAISDYFKAMFSAKMEESMIRTICIQDMDEKSFSCLLDYAYTGNISFTANNVQALLVTANMLGIQKVVDVCCDFLREKLHVSNCLSFLEFAELHSLKTLKYACVKCAGENFRDLVQYDEFLYQNSHIIEMVVSNDNLNVDNEECVFDFLEQWFLYDHEARKEQFIMLLNDIRISQLSSRFIVHLKSYSSLNSPIAYQFQLKLNTLARLKENPFRLLDGDLDNALNAQRRTPNNIIIIGGKEGLYQPLDTCSIYSLQMGTFTHCRSLPQPRFNAAAALVCGDIYLIGGMCCSNQVGQNDRSCTSSALRYSTKNGNWTSIANLQKQRSYLATASHGGYLYGIGGYDGKSCLKSIERYNPKTNTWSFIEDMKYSRCSFAAITLEDYIYVLGGQGTAHLCTVERYDTKKEIWEMMPAMSTKRINFGAAQVHGFIYVVGGHDGQDYLRSMERFDPYTSEWSVVAPMSSPRTGLGVTVLKNEIYILGGHDGSRYLKSCYKYNPREDSWKDVGDMLSARCSMAISDVWM